MIYTPNSYIKSLKPAEGYFYDEEVVEKAFNWLSKHIICPSGSKYANKPLQLLPWQKMVLRPLLGFRHKEHKTRQFEKLFLLIPKKSGKSLFCSALALYFMCTSKDFDPQIYTLACSFQQANTVWGSAVNMIKMSPTLSRKGLDTRSMPFPQIIIKGKEKNSTFRALSSDGKDKDGLRPSVTIVDEGHQIKNFSVYSLLTQRSAFFGRYEPLVLSISTAGEQEGTIFNQDYDYALKVQNGEIIDNKYLSAIWGCTQDENWEDLELHKKVNPSFGLTFSEEDWNETFKQAKGGDYQKNIFLRKNLNCWVPSAFDNWINSDTFDLCETDDSEFEKYFLDPNNSIYVGVDFAPNHDLTSIVLLVEVNGIIYMKHITFATRQEINRKSKTQGIPFDSWIRSGYLKMSADKTLTDEMFLGILNTELMPYKNNICSLTYDRHRIENVMLEFSDMVPYDVIDIPQNHNSLHEPTQAFYSLTMNQQLLHKKDPLLRYCVSNAIIDKSNQGLLRVSKKSQIHKVDIVSAAIFALDSLMRDKNMPPTVEIPDLNYVPTKTSEVINRFRV